MADLSTLFEQAVADFDRSLQLNPKPAEVYYHRGLAHRELGRFQCALDDFTRAIELKTDYAVAHCSRGNLLAATGRVN